jgi:hypothetical protein
MLKSSKISDKADDVRVLSYQDGFDVGDVQYYIIIAHYHEDVSHFLVNSKNGKTIYVNDFHQVVRTKKDEVFVVTVGNEAYSSDAGITIFSIDAEGNFVERFRIEGLFEEVSKIRVDDKGGFVFKSKQMDINKPFENRYIGDVLISYKDAQFTHQGRKK